MGIKKYLDTYERGVAFSVVQGGLGSFMNDQGDGSENVKKAIGLWSNTTSLHVRHAFFVHFFAVTARDYDWSFMEDVNKGRRILLKGGPQEINSRHIRLHLTFSANWNKRGKV